MPFHVDAVQTFGKLDLDVAAAGIDLLSFSGHKIYGPKGIAGLWIRKGTKMVSVQHGGEHERRRRAGTENVPGIVGLGKAVEVRARDMQRGAARVTALRDRLWEGIRARVPEVAPERSPDRAAARHGQHLLPGRGVGIRRPRTGSEGHRRVGGSACTSGNVEPSYVLVAMGAPLEWAMGAVRHSLGRSTTAEDIDYVVESVEPLVRKLRAAMPVGAA